MTLNRSLAIFLSLLVLVFATSLAGCGKKAEEKADDKHGDDKAKKTAPKKRAPKKAPKKKSSGSSAKGKKDEGGSGGSGSAKRARRTGKVSVDELVIKNPDRIENLLKAKDYKYPFKYNVFRDYVVREQEKIDTDGDGIPDLYDDDDDNDGFPDAVEIEQGFDPKNKYSHPQRTTLGGGAVIGGLGGPGAAMGGAAGSAAPGPAGGKGGKAPKGGESHGTPVGEVYETTGIYFRGIFGLRNSKVAVLKVIKDNEEKMLLKREGESFKGIQKGKSYFIKEINLQKDYIRVREESSGEVLTLTFEKKDKSASVAGAAATQAATKPGAKKGKASAKKTPAKKTPAKKPAPKKK